MPIRIPDIKGVAVIMLRNRNDINFYIRDIDRTLGQHIRVCLFMVTGGGGVVMSDYEIML